jgi:thiamine-phosphate pyrophosphorylase
MKIQQGVLRGCALIYMNLKKRLLRERRLYLIIDISAAKTTDFSKIKRILAAGVDIAQLRVKGLSDKIFLRYAKKLKKLCRLYNILFIVNDRPDIALSCGADGLHIGQQDLPPSICRKIIGKEKILGLSTHNIAQAKEAFRSKAIDYIGIGPIFKTKTKPDKRPIGPKIIRAILKLKSHTPFFAIGGISPNNIGTVISLGANSVALSSAIFDAKDPQAVIKKIRDRLYDTD